MFFFQKYINESELKKKYNLGDRIYANLNELISTKSCIFERILMRETQNWLDFLKSQNAFTSRVG